MYSEFFAVTAASIWLAMVGAMLGAVVLTFHALIYRTSGRPMNARQEVGGAMLCMGIIALVGSYGPGVIVLWSGLPVWVWRLLFVLEIVVGWVLMIPDDWWRKQRGRVTATLKQVRYLVRGISARRPLPA